MAAGGYQILDEPRPGSLAHLAVRPFWPLLALMIGGTWLAWPWFVLNSFAVGSPTRRRELLIAIGGVATTLAVVMALAVAVGAGLISKQAFAYWSVAITVVKIGFSYWLFVLQSRTFALYEYFGGRVANGAPVLLLGYFLSRRIADLPPLLMLLLT